MDIQSINGFAGNGFSGISSRADSKAALGAAKSRSEEGKFLDLVNSMKQKTVPTVASSQISSTRRLTGDYTQGFAGTYTSEKDKHAEPQGLAAATRTKKGEKPVIDRTSALYEQSMELENYMVKMMLSSARKTIQKSDLLGKENSYARDMYEDMLYDNYAEALTKNASLGLADQIYIELSGQR